jgi:hypothetical protein
MDILKESECKKHSAKYGLDERHLTWELFFPKELQGNLKASQQMPTNNDQGN